MKNNKEYINKVIALSEKKLKILDEIDLLEQIPGSEQKIARLNKIYKRTLDESIALADEHEAKKIFVNDGLYPK